MKCLFVFAIIGLLASVSRAEDPIEMARTKLVEAKKLYTETVERAKFDLEAAGAKEIKKLRASTKQSVADQVARIEKIEAQLREFSEYEILPTDAALRNDVDRYRETLKKAKQRCEKAFDALAQRYVTAKDDSNAKLILAEKESYFQKGFVPGMFEITMNPPLGHATLELKPDGTFKGIHDEREITTGTWEQTSKDELLLKYVSHNHGTSKLKIVDADHLTGANVHPNGNTWQWRVIRQSAATLLPGEFALAIDSGKDLFTYSFHKDGTCSSVSPDKSFRGAGNWWQFKDEIHYELTSQGSYGGVYGGGKLKIVDKDHLSGENFQDNRTWQWDLVRKQAAPTIQK